MTIPREANLDFASDALADSRRFRLFYVTADPNAGIAHGRGSPLLVVSDNLACEEGRLMLGAQVSDCR